MNSLQIDHVAFGWDSLETVREALDSVGMPYEYGGEHADGTTHMALTGFDDGSYLEYIAPTPDTEPSDAGFWPSALAARAGPAAWCVRTDDIVTAAKRAIESGLAIEGPFSMGRTRPDGRRLEWDQLFQGRGDDRWLYPFVIADRTPREWRVTPTDGTGLLHGIETVVLGVADLDDASATFGRRYRTPEPVAVDTGAFDADTAVVPGTSLSLARADEARLRQVGERPRAVLLGTDDLGHAQETLQLQSPVAWGERRVAWFDHPIFEGAVGVIE